MPITIKRQPTAGMPCAAMLLAAICFSLAWPAFALAAGGKGKFSLTVVDAETKDPLPCRIHLRSPNGKPRRVGKWPYWHDHFTFDGTLEMQLPYGTYTFDLEHGPEYHRRTGHFVLEKFADDSQVAELPRYVDMASEGWWSGDLCVARPQREMELLMRAEDLHVAQLVTWTTKRSEWAKAAPPDPPRLELADGRVCQLLAGRDERNGGAVLLLDLDRPLELPGGKEASLLPLLSEIRRSPRAWVDVERPYAWELPVWLALGLVDSIELANSHQCRGEGANDEAGGKPRDPRLDRGSWGNGQWSQQIYYHVLGAGLRIPPSAGSGSGVAPSPVGYNRVYVQCGSEFSYDAWRKNLLAGRVMVTNGPMLRPIVNGRHYPGHVFAAPAEEGVSVEIALNLATRDTVDYLEVIRDGGVEHTVRLADWAKTGKLPLLNFQRSGWFLVRAVTDVDKTYRFASTGPYYVEIGSRPRISRGSVQFFVDWMDELLARPAPKGTTVSPHVHQQYQSARQFWLDRLEQANVD
ncbi:MAG: hypothetical protein AB7I37_27075 [Pirellulales bacterium]